MDAVLLEQGGGDLGLNIVYEEVTPKPKRKRVRKQSKYEKRRAKARQAKQPNNDPVPAELTEAKPDDDNDAIRCSEKQEVKAVAANIESSPATSERQAQSDSNVEIAACPKSSAAASNTESQPKAKGQPLANATEMLTNGQVPLLCHASVGASTPQNKVSRKVHGDASLFLQDEQERARYMAEFHARPLEMDRRSGAVSQIVPSHESLHLFEANENEFQGLHTRLIASLHKMKVPRPTVIQTRAIRALQGSTRHNLFIQSETGSGKTLAYLLPILQSLAVDKTTKEPRAVSRNEGGTRCIILCPTRELASQTCLLAEKLCIHSFSWLVPGCLSGGEKRKSEKARIRKGIALLIATPGRLLDHLSKTESLLMALKGKLEWLVLDEADRLLDLGLGGQVQQIVQHVRANQPGSGPKRDGVTWNSVLVSATVTSRVQELGKIMLGGDDWLWARGGDSKPDVVESTKDSSFHGDETPTMKSNVSEGLHLGESTPRQLTQLHITVNAKLRLVALVAFLVQRVKNNERTVVFMSTCDGVDYHEALFTAMDCILPGDENDSTLSIFGKACPIFKLHGNVPHAERQVILQKFGQGAGSANRSALLLATDVAARGLNLPGVDWTVQYDPPCEIADYAHRAGRTARAGKGGHSLLFLLPSERAFLDVLESKGLKGMTALSLTSALNLAAKICADTTAEGEKRSGGGYGHSSAGRSGEAFCTELQHRLEGCVLDDDAKAKAVADKQATEQQMSRSGKRRKKEKVCGKLLEMARNAFTSFLRSYPTKEKAVRHIFSTRALHLGHVARSFALKDPPKALVKVQRRKDAATDQVDGRKRKNALMAFDEDGDGDTSGKRRKPSAGDSAGLIDNKAARTLMHSKAAKLQQGGIDAM